MSQAETGPGQRVLPGFQDALGIRKEVVPVESLDNLASQRRFSIDDVKRFMIEMGVCSEEECNQRIIRWRRSGSYVNDAIAAVFGIIVQAGGTPLVRSRFQEKYGVKMNIDSLVEKGFGGVDLDEENANLPRSKEDIELDKQKLEEDRKKSIQYERDYINDCLKSLGEDAI